MKDVALKVLDHLEKVCNWKISQLSTFSKIGYIHALCTPQIPEILCVKNVRAIVVCEFLILSSKKYAVNLKKIVGVVWELPAK